MVKNYKTKEMKDSNAFKFEKAMTLGKDNGMPGGRPLLEVEGFQLSFPQYAKGLERYMLQVISDFTLNVHAHEVVAVVGASGSGKSLLADAILGILPRNAVTSGKLMYDGKVLDAKLQKKIRGKELMLIPQSVKALDPLMIVEKQIASIIPEGVDKKRAIEDVFQKLSLPLSAAKKYPFELSGGMARRVLLAITMVSDARLIIADEPTPGLDEATRDEVLAHLKEILDAKGRSMLFITHDIHAALQIADKIAVFKDGKTLEIADTEVFSGDGSLLKHPYSRALWRALPENEFEIPQT